MNIWIIICALHTDFLVLILCVCVCARRVQFRLFFLSLDLCSKMTLKGSLKQTNNFINGKRTHRNVINWLIIHFDFRFSFFAVLHCRCRTLTIAYTAIIIFLLHMVIFSSSPICLLIIVFRCYDNEERMREIALYSLELFKHL